MPIKLKLYLDFAWIGYRISPKIITDNIMGLTTNFMISLIDESTLSPPRKTSIKLAKLSTFFFQKHLKKVVERLVEVHDLKPKMLLRLPNLTKDL